MDLEKRALAADLLHEFCWRADSGAGTGIAELFTDDATVATPHFRLAGREQIDAWFSERAKPGERTVRHLLSNLRFDEREDGTMEVTAYSMVTILLPTGEAARVAVGTSTDELVFEGGRALFARRQLDIAFEGRLPVDGGAA
ncbi:MULTISPECIES: nuclear transport factor 2 family protein [unclassified Sphingomonas]|uniref:nuclear transport factor 2 family protein n=1 Tax=unclassified Sphingomonas TaxID=196159 RepID=UPI0006FD4F72|nr:MULTISPECIES: nuclear transport factor 2 family protein [unclassified Sphingomonas]KQX23309.1 hypothetical protein ASD17_03060 [Sphingomonas sp. Root1294]KQY68157.1 hypothetical protein ASD39_05580 [Sphingomonas sp. Root50]KRB91050.1 hypothetical protein ASE22_12375 [Sphingomonas sp. Root720]